MDNSSAYPGDPAWIESLRKLHPFKLFIYVAVVGIGVMFLFLSVGFFSSPSLSVKLPAAFSISTITLLVSSITLYRVVEYFSKDKIQHLHYSLVATFMLGLVFVAMQMAGWRQLFTQQVYFDSKGDGSYLFLLSGLHLAHFFGGMVFFLVVFFRSFNAYRDSVKRLVYVTDPYEKMLLELLAIYWHFMDALWVALYIVMWAKLG